jgi:hypothetical protein
MRAARRLQASLLFAIGIAIAGGAFLLWSNPQ